MKRLCVLLSLLAALLGARAEGPDDQYVRIYNLIQQADSLQTSGKSSEALTKYLEAQSSLQRFQKGYPDWNVKVVTFRLNYLNSKVASLSSSIPAPAATPAISPSVPGTPPQPSNAPAPSDVSLPSAPARAAVPPDFENQLKVLRDQAHQLQAEKQVLEAKLKEALAAQPATVDAREFSEAQERVKTLQKENDLLRTSIAQGKANLTPVPDPKGLKKTQQALNDANRKLAEQTEKTKSLTLEKQALQTKLDSLIPGQSNAGTLDTTKKALAEANAKLARQTEIANRLATEKESLQSRVKSLSTENDSLQTRVKSLTADNEVAAVLRTENQLLKKQLAGYKTAPANEAKTDDASRKLAEAQTQIAALESDKEILRLEKIALENRVKQMSQPAVATAPVPPPSKKDANARIKQLELEKALLQKQLDTAIKESYARPGKPAPVARIEEMETQLANLRARLEVFEAHPVPYTSEELTLFRSPAAKLAKAEPSTTRKSVKELPAGTATLVAEAQRYFSNHQFDKAEEKYLQVLRKDQNNVYTLANLAAIELERNNLDQAEKHIKQAVAEAPDDGYSLSILGYLRFRQEKYDEAFDALSRAAQLNPESAEIQNFLGLTLSHKGMRMPAETALRKAIQLEPGYASAHNNLAVIYLTQQPPQVELARWHYQKAIAAGHPHNLDLERMLDQKKTADNR